MSLVTDAQTPQEFAAVWETSHVSDKFPSNVRHQDLKGYLEKLKKLGLRVREVGRSYENREIYQVEWGRGPLKVLMWSQMHGDEPTATPALIDMFAFLETHRDRLEWVKKLEETLTIRAVPMLNPDGAEAFRRRNAQGIDINRDTINLQTPEARLLLHLRNEWVPDIGFNLHNQRELTTVGYSTNQATISVLAVGADPEKPVSEGQRRNRRICALIVRALEQFIRGNIGRYDDSYTPNAFGDTFSDLGTPTILIETGGLHGRDEMYLVKLNFIAFLTALQSLADGSERAADVAVYENLWENTSGRLHNYLFRNAIIFQPSRRPEREAEPFVSRSGRDRRTGLGEIEPGLKPSVADVALNRERRRAEINYPPLYISRIGSLTYHRGLEEYDVGGYYMVAANKLILSGSLGTILFYKKTRQINWDAKDLETEYPPDAVFAGGRWLKPLTSDK